jgi:predicted DNA-binding transcriptional regulator AlpA
MIPTSMQWLNAEGVGQMLSTTARQVREEIATMPGFPKPARPVGPKGTKGHPRWLASEVHAWMEAQREATGGRPREHA